MGLTQVNTSSHLGQSYHLGRNSNTVVIANFQSGTYLYNLQTQLQNFHKSHSSSKQCFAILAIFVIFRVLRNV